MSHSLEAVCLVALAMLVPGTAVGADRGAASERAQVVYRSAGRVYLDVGAARGLTVGQRLACVGSEAVVLLEEVGPRQAAGVQSSPSGPPQPACVAVILPAVEPRPSAPGERAEGPGNERPRPSDAASRRLWAEASGAHAQPLRRATLAARRLESPRPRGGVRTRYRGLAPHAGEAPSSHEQRLWLALDLQDLLVRGLDLRVRGALDLRYDSTPDDYAPDRRAVLRLREARLRYAPASGGPLALLGRFPVPGRLGGPLDGAALGLRRGSYEVVGFGGLRPTPQDLGLGTDAQAFGLTGSAKRTLGSAGALVARAGYLGEAHAGAVERESLALDGRVRWGRALSLELASRVVLRRLLADGSVSGSTLGDLMLLGRAPLAADLGLELRADQHRSLPTQEELRGLPSSWAAELESARSRRVELLAPWRLARGIRVLPELRAVDSSADESWQAGGGLGLGLDRLGSSAMSFELRAAYLWGDAQQLHIDASLAGRIAQRSWLRVGVRSEWVQDLDSYLHALGHLAHARFGYEPRRDLRLGLDLQAALQHGIWAGAPLGAWYRGELSAAYRF